jgi:hypothetical protein
MAKDTPQQALTEHAAAGTEATKLPTGANPAVEPSEPASEPRKPVTHSVGIHLAGESALIADTIGLRPFRKSQGDRITPEIAKEAFPPDGVPLNTISNRQLVRRARETMIVHGIKDISDDTILRRFGRRKSRRF